MIYLIGNINKSSFKKLTESIRGNDAAKAGFLIVFDCDISIVQNQQVLNILSDLGLKMLLVDGGQFSSAEYPEIEKFAGHVQQINNNCFLLNRGQVYVIDNHKILVWGSQKSTKVASDTILPPSITDMDAVLDTLEWHNNEMDYIIAHEAPASLIQAILKSSKTAQHKTALSSFFDILYETVEFKKWYCSAYGCHTEVGKVVALHEQIRLLDE